MTWRELSRLVRVNGFPCVSIYIPTHRTFPDTKQDPIRLSKALTEAEAQLRAAGVANPQVMLAAARQRSQEQMFWRYQDRGLAVFIREDATRWLKLPAEVPEIVVVADRFHVRPLVGMFADRGSFHLLAATRESVRLFEGAEREFEVVDVEGLPTSLAGAKESTDFDDQLGYHSRVRGAPAGPGSAPKYHTLGQSPEDYEDVELDNFLRSVAKAVDRHLADRAGPLVLAAEPRVLGRLRKALRYGEVAAAAIQRDPASLQPAELHAQAWPIADAVLRGGRDKARERLAARLDGGGVPGAEDVAALFAAAKEGRLETLLLARDQHVWGRYDEASGAVSIDQASAPDNEDLLNLLAVNALAQGGDVISLPERLAARAGPAAGLFRY
jgi:hypothetical protein